MKTILILVCIFMSSQVWCIDIPGCGELQSIKWNTSCMLSSKKSLHSLNDFVFSIENLLLFDGMFYYIVPPKSPETFKSIVKRELMRMTNNEIDLKVVDVAHSPLKFSGIVKGVKNYETGVVFQQANMKTQQHSYLVGKKLKYVSVGHLYSLMRRVFKNYEVNENHRNSTIFLTNEPNQGHLDWETGASINCFSSDGLIYVKTTRQENNILYILRSVLFYSPNHHGHNKLQKQQLPQDVFNYCKNNGYAYDSSGGIQDSKKYNISICTMFYNEAQYFLEWIAYHTIIGVEHFYLFNDNSTDESMEVLQPLIDQNLVTIFNISNMFLKTHIGFQESFLTFLGENYSFETKWFLSIDVDEFLVIKDPKYNNNINEFIQQNQQFMRSETGQMLIAREEFAGTYEAIQKKQLVTNELNYKIYRVDDRDTKTLFNTNGLDRMWVHTGYTFAPTRNVKMQKNCHLNLTSDIGIHSLECLPVQPLSIFHYVMKYYDRCIAKMKPVNKNLKKIKSGRKYWRAESGEKYCKEMAVEKKYYPEKWERDFTLFNITNQICQKMQLLNENWYNKNQICQDY